MQIRPGLRSDIPAIAALWMHTFPAERSLPERIHDLETGGPFGGIETVEVAEDETGLLGALKIQAMKQHLGGALLPMMGLAAVAVGPWARRRGVGATLCRHALRRARERGDVVSALYPFRPDFYQRLGWALVGELHVYRFRPEMLASAGGAPVRLAGREDEAAIAACYERVARTSHGLIERGPRVWRRHLDAPDTYAFVHQHDTGVQGYMLLRYGRAPGGREHRTLFIRELVAEDTAVEAAMFGWISLQRDLWRKVRYDARPDEHFALRLCDPRPPGFRGTRWLWDPVARIIRGPMLRILNLREAVERRATWGPAPPLTFTLALRDPVLSDNEADTTFDFDGARAVSVARAAAGRVNRIETDIGTLTQIYAGELGARSAVRLGMARVDGDMQSLDTLFRPASAFRLLDEF